jgi:hypothetical protein
LWCNVGGGDGKFIRTHLVSDAVHGRSVAPLRGHGQSGETNVRAEGEQRESRGGSRGRAEVRAEGERLVKIDQT